MIKVLKNEKFQILLLVLICLFFFFFNLGGYKLIDVDEPRYAEAAREMIESSNWITPYFNYELRFDKPVLFYWLIAISYLVFGVTEFAARFPSAVLSVLMVFFNYYFARKTISKSFAFISSLILVSALEFIAIGRMSITDMTLAFFICATIYSGFLGSFVNNNMSKYWWWLAYLFSGLAVLTKGPVGFILPALVFGIYFTLTGKLKENLKPSYSIPGFLIFALTVVPWYYAIIKEHGMTFINYFFLKHNLSRFANSGFGQHQQPFYFYFIVVFAGAFPWSIYFISAFAKHIKKLYEEFVEAKAFTPILDLAFFKNSDGRTKVILYCILWFLCIFIFYSFSGAKLLTYILPVFPAIALLTGFIWDDFINNGKDSRNILICSVIWAVICLIMAFIMIFGFNKILPRDEKLVFEYINISLILLFVLIPALVLFFIHKKRSFMAFLTVIFLMAGVLVVAVTNVLPAVYKSGQIDLIKYVKFTKKLALPNKKLLTYGLVKPSIIFYAQSKVPSIDGNDYKTMSDYLNSSKPVFIIIKKRQFDELSTNLKFNLIDMGVRYALISNRKVTFTKESD